MNNFQQTWMHRWTAAFSAFAVGVGVLAAAAVLFSVVPKTPAHGAVYPGDIMLDPSAIIGYAAVVYDPTTGRALFAKNADDPRPLASLTKLMTAEVALGAVGAQTPVSITSDDLKPQGDWGLRPGEVLPLKNLLSLGLVASSNDAMAAVAESVGSGSVEQMNQQAAALGLASMHFFNPTGLDLTPETAGAYGSARDVARLAAHFARRYPQFFEQTVVPSVSVAAGKRLLGDAATTVPLQDVAGLVGAKTGYTDLAQGNLVVVFDLEPGHPLVAAVLGSTETGRFDDIRALINASRNQ